MVVNSTITSSQLAAEHRRVSKSLSYCSLFPWEVLLDFTFYFAFPHSPGSRPCPWRSSPGGRVAGFPSAHGGVGALGLRRVTVRFSKVCGVLRWTQTSNVSTAKMQRVPPPHPRFTESLVPYKHYLLITTPHLSY